MYYFMILRRFLGNCICYLMKCFQNEIWLKKCFMFYFIFSLFQFFFFDVKKFLFVRDSQVRLEKRDLNSRGFEVVVVKERVFSLFLVCFQFSFFRDLWVWVDSRVLFFGYIYAFCRYLYFCYYNFGLGRGEQGVLKFQGFYIVILRVMSQNFFFRK